MAKTTTRTWTNTYTRLKVLSHQIRNVVMDTTQSSTIGKILEEGIINNQWLEVVSVYAVKERQIYAEIVMAIDWNRYEMSVKTKGNISINENLHKGEHLNSRIQRIVEFFNERVEEEGLETLWAIRCRDGEETDRLFEKAGLKPGRPLRWAEGERQFAGGDVPKILNEFSIDLYMLVPKEGSGRAKVMANGVVNEWHGTFGSIIPDGSERKLFVHYSAILMDGYRSLSRGQKVRFDITKDSDGRERAVNVEVIQ